MKNKIDWPFGLKVKVNDKYRLKIGSTPSIEFGTVKKVNMATNTILVKMDEGFFWQGNGQSFECFWRRLSLSEQFEELYYCE